MQKYNSFGQGKVKGSPLFSQSHSPVRGGSTLHQRKSILAYYFPKLTTRATTTRTYSRGFTLALGGEKKEKVTTSQSGKIHQSTLVRQQRMVHDTTEVHGPMKLKIEDGPFSKHGPVKTLKLDDSFHFF